MGQHGWLRPTRPGIGSSLKDVCAHSHVLGDLARRQLGLRRPIRARGGTGPLPVLTPGGDQYRIGTPLPPSLASAYSGFGEGPDEGVA